MLSKLAIQKDPEDVKQEAKFTAHLAKDMLNSINAYRSPTGLLKKNKSPTNYFEEGFEGPMSNFLDPRVLESRKNLQSEYKSIAELLRRWNDKEKIDFHITDRLIAPIMKKEDGTPLSLTDEHRAKLRQMCRQKLWERMSSDLLNQEELMHFYAVLEKWADKKPELLKLSEAKWKRTLISLKERGELQQDKYITMEHLSMAARELDSRFRNLGSAILFNQLLAESDDRYYRVPIILVFNYVMKKVWLKQTRLGLLNYDEDGTGFITEDGFESYLKELIPTLSQLSKLDPGMEPYYLCAATRVFFFFLDPMRHGKVRLLDVLCSQLVDDILELRENEVKANNWFSLDNVMTLYQHYLKLDRNEDGMLSRGELLHYNFGSHSKLTSIFIERVYAEINTYSSDVDFRSFVDFVIALENKKETVSIAYFMRILDLNHKGYLNSADLNYFWKGIIATPMTFDVPKFDDVKDEIFDMVKPANPERITAKDLEICGRADVVINMLIDAKGFDDYENREVAVQQPPSKCDTLNESMQVTEVEDFSTDFSGLRMSENELNEGNVSYPEETIGGGGDIGDLTAYSPKSE